jgi:hypothetical protein
MVPLTALWVPILLSAVIVFVASSILHMVLPYHRSDYKKLPDEEKIMAAIRSANPPRGLYMFPNCSHKDMNSPESKEKFKLGPVGTMTMFPIGMPSMPKFLGLWFVYCLIVSGFVACLAGSVLAPGTAYLSVFHVAAIAAFMAYGIGILSNGIWKGMPWSVVIKEAIDGLIYALLTAGTFGWRWPH